MRELVRGIVCVGMPVSVLGMLGAAALLTAVDVPGMAYGFFATLPVAVGACLAGRCAGRVRRHGGWRVGLWCGLCLTLIWAGAAMGMGLRVRSMMLLLVTIPAGMLGGIWGVNCTELLPKRLFSLHLMLWIKERVKNRRKLCEKPKNRKKRKNA